MAGVIVTVAGEAPLPDQIMLPEWAQWVILMSGLALAVRTLWLKVVKPISRTLVLMEDVLPTLQEIAHHFKPNGGSSLYDVVTRIDGELQTLRSEFDTHSKVTGQPPLAVDRVDRLKEIVAESVEAAIHTLAEEEE